RPSQRRRSGLLPRRQGLRQGDGADARRRANLAGRPGGAARRSGGTDVRRLRQDQAAAGGLRARPGRVGRRPQGVPQGHGLRRQGAALPAGARPAEYEGFTCLKDGTTPDEGQIDRDGEGVRWAWKKGTPPLTPGQQDKLVRQGRLKADEALLQLRDADTGQAVTAHSGSVYWNDHRKRWVMIAVQSFGTSLLGEVGYAEADTPLGPWVYAR